MEQGQEQEKPGLTEQEEFALLSRFWGYVQKGRPFEQGDQEKIYTISLNKGCKVAIYSHTHRRHEQISFQADTAEIEVNSLILQEIVRKVIQEGPVGLNYEWGVEGPDRIDWAPGPGLKVRVHSWRFTATSTRFYQRVPVPPDRPARVPVPPDLSRVPATQGEGE